MKVPPAFLRKNLVVVRAGNNSLHREWLSDGSRDFDLFVSYFGPDAGTYVEDGEYHEHRKGPKWPSLKELFTERPDLASQYDAIWLPDDDLSASASTINRMFALFHGFDLALAQPALTPDSFYSWEQVLQRPEFVLRYVNFVEVMAPVFSREALQKCVKTFDESRSGWGLDFVWPHLCATGERSIAIIDRAPVTHTRPLGGELYRNNPELDPGRDLQALLRKYGLADVPGLVRHALLGAVGEVGTSPLEGIKLRLKKANAERLAQRRASGGHKG